MKPLTDKQKQILSFLRSSFEKSGIAPSVREIASAVGLSSTASVQYNLDALEKAGAITRGTHCSKRTIRLTDSPESVMNVPLVGTVTAGVPILADEMIEEYIAVSGIKTSGTLFALKVRGDSMVNAHIVDGDIAVVEQCPIADNGDIVVALIDNEATVKRFYKEKGHFRLQPENDEYQPIIVENLTLLGKVKTVIRQY